MKKTNFLHGYVKNDWKIVDENGLINWKKSLENLNIVLGIDDVKNDLKKHKIFQFTKYFQKLHRNTDYQFLNIFIKEYEKGKLDALTRKATFYFWGHSLDESDENYINEVFYFVSNTQSMIKIFYHNINSKSNQLRNLLNIIDKNKIEDLMKNGKLTFLESTPENLFKELA